MPDSSTMQMRARTRGPRGAAGLWEADRFEQGAGWFVYLLALTDCSAFKVGFTCNPLQRLCAFTPRYYERFDLRESRLLRVADCDEARAVEAALKQALATQHAEAPCWFPQQAGGYTEWFNAVCFADAEQSARALCASNADPSITALDYVMSELAGMTQSFEAWAWRRAHELREAFLAANRGYAVNASSKALRDWLNAYEFFALPLFRDDPLVLAFVRESARLDP